MGFLTEVLQAVFLVGVPVAIFTLALVWWALQGGHLKESSDTGALRRELKAMAGSGKKDKKGKKQKKESDDGNQKKLHPLQKKWARFGGGFYGIVAFFTYLVIEVREVIDTVTHLGGFLDFLGQLDLNLIIKMLVQALLNFVNAMIWPAYWMQRIHTQQVWVWFLVAYAGYWSGLKLAQALARRRPQTGE